MLPGASRSQKTTSGGQGSRSGTPEPSRYVGTQMPSGFPWESKKASFFSYNFEGNSSPDKKQGAPLGNPAFYVMAFLAPGFTSPALGEHGLEAAGPEATLAGSLKRPAPESCQVSWLGGKISGTCRRNKTEPLPKSRHLGKNHSNLQTLRLHRSHTEQSLEKCMQLTTWWIK